MRKISDDSRWNADTYARHAGFVPKLGEDVLSLLAAKPGERILDIGCGDGVLTRRIIESGAQVVGLEPDPSLAAKARQNGINVIQQDAHRAFGEMEFDAVFSNAALHWMHAPEVVLANAYAALRPGGRLVAEQGGFGNVAAVLTALNASLEAAGYSERCGNPWDFPTVIGQRARLERAGFQVRELALIHRPTVLDTGFEGWLMTFGMPFLSGLEAQEKSRIIIDCTRRLAHMLDEAGRCHADYVRLRFSAECALD